MCLMKAWSAGLQTFDSLRATQWWTLIRFCDPKGSSTSPELLHSIVVRLNFYASEYSWACYIYCKGCVVPWMRSSLRDFLWWPLAKAGWIAKTCSYVPLAQPVPALASLSSRIPRASILRTRHVCIPILQWVVVRSELRNYLLLWLAWYAVSSSRSHFVRPAASSLGLTLVK